MEPQRQDVQKLTTAVNNLAREIRQLKSVLATGILFLDDKKQEPEEK